GTNVTLVLLGNSSFTINGGAVVDLSAPTVNTTSSHLNGVLIDDQAPNSNSFKVTVNGNGSVKMGGAMYFPNVNVTWNGTSSNSHTNCSMVIANTVDMSGGAYMSAAGCTPNTIPQTQVVTLVQ